MHSNVETLASLYESKRSIKVKIVELTDHSKLATASGWAIPDTAFCFNLVTRKGENANPIPLCCTAKGTLIVPSLASYPSSMGPTASDTVPSARNAFKGAWDVCLYLDSFIAGKGQRTAAIASPVSSAPKRVTHKRVKVKRENPGQVVPASMPIEERLAQATASNS